MTIEAVALRWLDANPSKRPTTFATDEVMVRVHLLPSIGDRRIGSISPPDVQELVNEWSQRAAPRTVRRRYGVLKAVMSYAVEADWLARSPCRRVKLPPLSDKKRQLLEPNEVAALAASTTEEYRPIVWVGALLGLRWSEVAALRVRSIDILGRRVTVSEAVTRDRQGRPVFGPPKSAAGARTLAIPDALADILSEHMAARG
jgi:integrase